MREQSCYLRSHYKARVAIKEVIEMPCQQFDWVIRSIEENNGLLSHVLAKEFSCFLKYLDRWEAVVSAVQQAFTEGGLFNTAVLDRYDLSRLM